MKENNSTTQNVTYKSNLPLRKEFFLTPKQCSLCIRKEKNPLLEPLVGTVKTSVQVESKWKAPDLSFTFDVPSKSLSLSQLRPCPTGKLVSYEAFEADVDKSPPQMDISTFHMTYISAIMTLWEIFTFIILQALVTTKAFRIVMLDVPSPTILGESVELTCSYELDNEQLYSVKWYKNDVEFYRYVPNDWPPGQFLPLPGIRVDVSTKF
ncbi:uncharacterized protein TNCT_640921 [Trichonephila clavata]|uniref:Ig-like domain-containing protein n=1 Tax=Trichonephila clavata TaxID=2740835 RepID=A0A8X6LDK8_TRICU|nr:uncharacterized protein TNCT_640921 [Trichonephila clavata]